MRGAVAREARYGGQGEQVRVWHKRGRAGRRVAHLMFTATRNPARPSGRTAARAAAKARDGARRAHPPHRGGSRSTTKANHPSPAARGAPTVPVAGRIGSCRRAVVSSELGAGARASEWSARAREGEGWRGGGHVSRESNPARAPPHGAGTATVCARETPVLPRAAPLERARMAVVT